MINWHEKTIQSATTELATNAATGLSTSEAAKRVQEYGPNEYTKPKQDSIFQMVLRQCKDVANIVLLFAALLSLALAIREGHGYIEPIVIFAIITMNTTLAVSQERSAEKALLALESLSSPSCYVLREGVQTEIPSIQLVPGDIIILKTGDMIPADVRLMTTTNLAVDESSLTGESEPVEKDATYLSEADASLGDQANMAFSGCLVTAGNATAVVVETGMQTQMGKIAGYLNNAQKLQTPLQKRLNKVSQTISVIALISAAVLLMVGIRQGEDFWTMMLAAVSLAVAAVPETLQLIVTLALTHGVKKMVTQHALIRKLPAVETLGSTSIICSDKTGTLTQNRMTIQKLWVPGDEDAVNAEDVLENEQLTLLRYLAMASNATVEGHPTPGKAPVITGDATESAILRLLLQKGEDRQRLVSDWPRVGEIPFSSARKMMTSIHQCPQGGYVVLTKGAFDRLPFTSSTTEERAKRKAMHDLLANQALRVIALGSRHIAELPSDDDLSTLEDELSFAGLIGLMDPPRPEVAHSIATAKKAGIRTIMITGDHAATAETIAKQIGLLKDGGQVITGRQLSKLSDEDLVDNIQNYSVYARVSPEDKIRIVEAWQEQGEVVSMTGDGVNDAPALKAADVGIAMGITGTEVAKNAADMILTDDHFATIVSAIREGRNVFSNIRKTIYFLLVCNLSEIVIMLGAQLMGWGIPLTPVMLLLINVLGDGVPGLHLAREKSDPRIMSRKPIDRNESFFGDGLLKVIMQQTFAFSIVGLVAYYLGAFLPLPSGAVPSMAVGQTMAFLTVAVTSILHIFTVRSRISVFKRTVKDNIPLVLSAIGMILIFSIMVLLPQVGKLFGLVPLGFLDWMIVLVLILIPTVVAELGKMWDNRCNSELNRHRLVKCQKSEDI